MTFHSQLSSNLPEGMLGGKPKSLRAFVGYAGWTGGQLESELQQSAWIIHPATESLLQGATNERTWVELMRDFGPAYYLLAMAPDDPSLN